MARTESKSLQVHPDREQSTIRFMENFHWNLINSQHVKNKTKSSHLERRGDEIYQVTETETEHFVNLAFTRDLDAPGMDRVRALESEYHALEASKPDIPEKSGYIWPFIVCFFLTAFWGLGIIIGLIWFPQIAAKNKRVENEKPGILQELENIERRQSRILEESRNVNTSAPPAAVAASAPVPLLGGGDDVAFWDRIDKTDTDDLQEYLLRFPDGRFVELAKVKLERAGVPLLAPAPRALGSPGEF